MATLYTNNPRFSDSCNTLGIAATVFRVYSSTATPVVAQCAAVIMIRRSEPMQGSPPAFILPKPVHICHIYSRGPKQSRYNGSVTEPPNDSKLIGLAMQSINRAQQLTVFSRQITRNEPHGPSKIIDWFISNSFSGPTSNNQLAEK